jgi:trehalose 6-phosphate phosphatase
VKYLFSHEGRPALKRIAADSKILIAIDFDGTLAPIVHQPPHARMPQSIAHELDRLCAIASVAIISGRELGDLEQRVSAKVAFLIGNHGNEGLASTLVDAGACRNICASWTKQLRHMPALHTPGIVIEPKGYTLAVHYRLADDHDAVQEVLAAAFEDLTPAPRVIPGKCVFDLFPPGAVCKDDTMRLLVKQLQATTVLYIGDDECDELVFATAEPDWITIRVGYWRNSAAKYYLRYQREVRDLLLLLNLQLGLTTANGD